MAARPVKVNYRRYYRLSDPPFEDSLAGVTKTALYALIEGVSLTSDVRLRAYRDGDGSTILLNGHLVTKTGAIFGELVRYNPDTNIPLLMQGAEPQAELEIREANKPNNAEFLRGMAFFMLRDDHVLIVEQDLGASALERYLRWVIFTQARVSVKDSRIQLVPQVFLAGDGAELKSVNLISLKPPPTNAGLFHATQAFSQEEGETTDVLGILKAAHFDTAVLERIIADKQASVQIKLEVTLKAGRKRMDLDGTDALALLRNVDDDDLIINGDGARKNRGVLERLSIQEHIERKGNILDRRDAWAALERAAARYREAGHME
jgi:hypothetical protein